MLRPTVFDITAYYEPSAHFQYSRRIRDQFEHLAKQHYRSTWMLGRYGGLARMQTDIQGIGVATRIEVGRLVLREGRRQALIHSAFELFREAEEHGLVSGCIDRLLVYFPKADERPRERFYIGQAYAAVFAGVDCTFLNRELDLLELGHCVAYQSLVQYLREDGLYHSSHRGRIDTVHRHLQQEVGRYESYKFYVRPEAVAEGAPRLDFCYTGTVPDRKVEAFMQGYTGEQPVFVAPEDFRSERQSFVELTDYERASRRFGGLWILQQDIVRYLMPQQVNVLYLFMDEGLQPELDRVFSWDELFTRQRQSPYISRASRNSQTFLEMVLEGLVRNRFVLEDDGRFRLCPGFQDFQHVSFYQLGEYRKRLQ